MKSRERVDSRHGPNQFVAGEYSPGRNALVGSRLIADHFERVTALPLAQPSANQRRQIAAAGLTEVNSDISRQWLIVWHSVHLLGCGCVSLDASPRYRHRANVPSSVGQSPQAASYNPRSVLGAEPRKMGKSGSQLVGEGSADQIVLNSEERRRDTSADLRVDVLQVVSAPYAG
jgi:hypothetical protein